MSLTTIEWTDETWNPATGCTKVSPGCDHCYAETYTNRFKRQQFGDIQLHEDRLAEPLRWRTPKHVFVWGPIHAPDCEHREGFYHESAPARSCCICGHARSQHWVQDGNCCAASCCEPVFEDDPADAKVLHWVIAGGGGAGQGLGRRTPIGSGRCGTTV